MPYTIVYPSAIRANSAPFVKPEDDVLRDFCE